MWSDDAVESVESHAGDEEHTAHGGRQKDEGGDVTVRVLVRRHVYVMSSVQVSKQCYNCTEKTHLLVQLKSSKAASFN